MPALSVRVRYAQRPCVGQTTRTVRRRQIFQQARAPGHDTPKPVNNKSVNQEFSHNVNSVWQQTTNTAAGVAKHPAGLFSLGALVAVLALAVFKRVWRALGFDRNNMQSRGGGQSLLLTLIHRFFPPKDQQDGPDYTIWPGPLPGSYRADQAAVQGSTHEQLQASTRSADGRERKSEEADRTKLSEMSGVVKQASQKVAALEQMVSALRSQVKIAERRAGRAEGEAASLGNKMSIQDANAAKVRELTLQLNAAEEHVIEKTQALASANNEIRSLQQARQLLFAQEQQSAERLEQESLTQHNIGSLRRDLDVMRRQLTSNEAAIAEAQAREQTLLQQLNSSQEAKRSAEATLLEAAEERVELEASLSEAEGTAASMQLSLEGVQGLLAAAEAQRNGFASQVDILQREVSAAAASVKARDESIVDLQRQLQTVRQHLQERQQALDRMEAGAADRAELAAQLQQLRSSMSDLTEARHAALQEAAAATAELKQVQQEVSAAVDAIAEVAAAEDGSGVAGPAGQGADGGTAPLPPSECGLPSSELRARVRREEARLQQLRRQAGEIEEQLPVQAQRELALLRSQLETLESRAGPVDAPATDLQTAQVEVRAAAQSLLRDMLSTQQFRAHEQALRDIEGCEHRVAALRRECERTLQERVMGVLSLAQERSRRDMLAEVAAAEAASSARAQALVAEAEASAEAQQCEVEAWKQQQEEALAAQVEDSRRQSQEQQREVVQQQGALEQQQAALEQQQTALQAQAADLQAQAADQARLQEELRDLEVQYGNAEATARRAAQLQELQEQLAAQQAEVSAAEARAAAAAAEAAGEVGRVAEMRAQAEAAQQAAATRQQQLSLREAELGGKQQHVAAQLGGLNQQLEGARALADREAGPLQVAVAESLHRWVNTAAVLEAVDLMQVRQMRDAAAIETDALKQRLQKVQAAREAEVEAAQAGLQEKVAALERELFTLKDRYSRQFIDYKQQLDVSEDRVRRLRNELAERAAGEAPASGGGEPGEPRDTGGAEPPLGGTSSVQDVSMWASQLVTKLSEETNGGRGGESGTATAGPGAGAEAEQLPVWPSAESAVAAPVTEAEEEEDTLRLQSSGHCIPHPAKVERGGEDAHFILGSYAIGVADGVGGWSKNGVDPGEYSRELMRQTAQALRRDRRRSMSCVDALTAAHDVVNMPGTSTAIVARMVDDTHLEVINLGDSGLRVIRDGEIVFATESLQHGFNMPFQLGCKEIIPYTDLPDSALRAKVAVEAGDVVIMASDGFFDNVWDQDLARLVKNSCLFEGYERENCVEHMAEALAHVAAVNSKDATLRTPWSVACAKNKDVGLLKKLFPQGGKVDDISVIVAQVEAPGDS